MAFGLSPWRQNLQSPLILIYNPLKICESREPGYEAKGTLGRRGRGCVFGVGLVAGLVAVGGVLS